MNPGTWSSVEAHSENGVYTVACPTCDKALVRAVPTDNAFADLAVDFRAIETQVRKGHLDVASRIAGVVACYLAASAFDKKSPNRGERPR